MKPIIYLIMALLMVGVASAMTLENNTWYYPSQNNVIFMVNLTRYGITATEVNETCVTINTTDYCLGTDTTYWLDTNTIISYLPFNFTILDVGMEWIKLSWNSSLPINAEYSFDNPKWENVTVIESTYGIQYALPSSTMVYLRAKNTSTGFNYINQSTELGGESMLDIFDALDQESYLYILAFIVFLVLIGIGYWTEEWVFIMVAGMLSTVIGITIYNYGFPNLENVFLTKVIVLGLWGVGAYFILAPAMQLFDGGEI